MQDSDPTENEFTFPSCQPIVGDNSQYTTCNLRRPCNAKGSAVAAANIGKDEDLQGKQKREAPIVLPKFYCLTIP